jgi:hypothetical protein
MKIAYEVGGSDGEGPTEDQDGFFHSEAALASSQPSETVN